MKKAISVILLLSVLLMGCYSVHGEAIVPYYNNTNQTSEAFVISSTGYATTSFGYAGISGKTTGATIYSYIEHLSGSTWVQVGSRWTDTSSSYQFDASHNRQLYEKGLYRLCVQYHIYGVNPTDNLTKYVSYMYS